MEKLEVDAFKPEPRCNVRFTEEEFKKINEHKTLTGDSLPHLLKKAYFSKKPVTPIVSKDDFRILIVELKRIGNNINQLTRKFHSTGDAPSRSTLSQIAEELRLVRSFFLGKYDKNSSEIKEV